MRLALVAVAMTPEHQLFQHEKQQDAEQHRRCHAVHAAGKLEGVRQDLEEYRAQQRTDGVADQHRNPCGTCVERHETGSSDAKQTAEQA